MPLEDKVVPELELHLPCLQHRLECEEGREMVELWEVLIGGCCHGRTGFPRPLCVMVEREQHTNSTTPTSSDCRQGQKPQ